MRVPRRHRAAPVDQSVIPVCNKPCDESDFSLRSRDLESKGRAEGERVGGDSAGFLTHLGSVHARHADVDCLSLQPCIVIGCYRFRTALVGME